MLSLLLVRLIKCTNVHPRLVKDPPGCNAITRTQPPEISMSASEHGPWSSEYRGHTLNVLYNSVSSSR